MAESKQEVLRQIQEAWKAAQQQLEDLRAAVARTGDLAQLKVEAEFLNRDIDRAFRDLGEAVWGQVKRGTVKLPSSVAAQVKAVEEAERKLAAHQTAINDLLSEGAELAGKLKAEKKTPSSGKVVAAKGKKR